MGGAVLLTHFWWI